MQDSKAAPLPKIKIILGMMLSPGTFLKNAVSSIPFFFSTVVSSLAFGLFFLQTGLDLYKTGQQPVLFVIVTSLIGILFGLLAVPLISLFIWVITKIFGCNKTVKWTVSTFCLSYSGALVYGIFGLIASLVLGWRTSIAFGVTGLMWTLGPMIATLREMLKGKILLCVILAAAVGAIVLYCWSFIGRY